MALPSRAARLRLDGLHSLFKSATTSTWPCTCVSLWKTESEWAGGTVCALTTDARIGMLERGYDNGLDEQANRDARLAALDAQLRSPCALTGQCLQVPVGTMSSSPSRRSTSTIRLTWIHYFAADAGVDLGRADGSSDEAGRYQEGAPRGDGGAYGQDGAQQNDREAQGGFGSKDRKNEEAGRDYRRRAVIPSKTRRVDQREEIKHDPAFTRLPIDRADQRVEGWGSAVVRS